MHKRTKFNRPDSNRTQLTVTTDQTRESRTAGRQDRASQKSAFKKRTNHRKRNWNRILKVFALALFFAEAGVLLLASPALRVTQVSVEGTQTLSPEQVFEEARVPNQTNIFWMLRQPLTKRLEADPGVDHAVRSIKLPNRLVLTVTERQPCAVLAAGGQFWLLDKKGVPYRELDQPMPHVPVVQVAESVLPAVVVLGKPLHTPWLIDAYRLMTLLRGAPELDGTKITVDQNLNLCLNRRDNLQIRLGQPDSLPFKVALANASVAAHGGALARQAAYIDVSCPQQPVYMPRKEKSSRDQNESYGSEYGSESRSD